MVSSDTLGYPIKKHFYRLHLESAWRAAFGALDMGDFETFLKESADRTYPDALAQIRKMGAGRSETSQVKESQEYEAQGGIEQYRMVADGLRQEGKEYEASAIEALIADLVVAQSKAKARRKPAEKQKAKQKPLVDSTVQTPALTPQTPAPTEYIKELCKKSPLTQEEIENLIRNVKFLDIEAAIKIIRECPSDTLDAFDKYEIEELLKERAAGITRKEPERIHAPAKTLAKETQRQKFGRIARESRERGLSFEEHIEAMKRGLTKPEEEEGRPEEPEEERNSIRTGKDIFKKEVDKEEVPRRPENVRGISGVKRLKATEAAGTARADTASNAAQKLKSHLSEIILYGLREYIQKNNINLPVNNLLLTMLAEELIALWFQKVREPTNVREAIGQAIVKREGVMLLASGIEYVKDSNTMREMYEIAKAQNPDMPDFNTAVKGVANAILKIK